MPRGSRILPNKESVSLTSNAFGGVVQGSMEASSGNGGGMSSVIGVLTNIDQHLSALIDRIRESRSGMEVSGYLRLVEQEDSLEALQSRLPNLQIPSMSGQKMILMRWRESSKEICRSNCKYGIGGSLWKRESLN